MESLEILRYGQKDKFLKVEVEKKPTYSLAFSAPSEDLLMSVESLCKNAIFALRSLLSNNYKVLKGGGKWQVEIANRIYGKIQGNLNIFSDDLGVEQSYLRVYFQAFCRALVKTGLIVGDENLLDEVNSDLNLKFFQTSEKSLLLSSKNIYDNPIVMKNAFETVTLCLLRLICTDQFLNTTV